MSSTCPFCREAVEPLASGTPDVSVVECPRCGDFSISGTALEEIKGKQANDRRLWSGHLRELRELGRAAPKITSYDILGGPPDSAPKTPSEQADRLLQRLRERTESPLAPVDVVSPVDYPLGYVSSVGDFSRLMQFLQRRGDIEPLRKGGEWQVYVTPEGWERQGGSANAGAADVFVGMSFDEQLLATAYEGGIRPAIRGCGYNPVLRVGPEYEGRIDDFILAAINRSRFVVADFTQHKQNVYFEVGHAFGRGTPIIWTCRAGDIAHAHFDTRQFAHIVWKDPNHLRGQLEAAIERRFGFGPLPRK